MAVQTNPQETAMTPPTTLIISNVPPDANAAAAFLDGVAEAAEDEVVEGAVEDALEAEAVPDPEAEAVVDEAWEIEKEPLVA
jgi:hypothetical protein